MNDDTTHEVQRTIRDVQLLRSLLQRSEQRDEDKRASTKIALQTHVLLHLGALCLVCSLLYVELFNAGFNTRLLLYSANYESLRVVGIANMGILLILLLLALYFVLFRSAQKAQLPLQVYVDRHFRYLANLTLLTDLFVKFCLLSLVIAARRPEWMAPVLMLYLGEYLFQGRFFVLPLRVSLVTGSICFCLAVYQLWSGDPALVWPLSAFLLAGMLSLYCIGRLSKEDAA